MNYAVREQAVLWWRSISLHIGRLSAKGSVQLQGSSWESTHLSLNVVIKALTGDMGCMSLSADEMREEMSSVPESILAALLLRKLARVTAAVYAVSRAVRRQQRLWGSSREAASWGR